MPSPFPGMDPYIEACGLWEDFHSHLIEKIYDLLAGAAPERYLVRTGERSYLVLVENRDETRHTFMPDVKVTGPRKTKRPGKKNGPVAVADSESVSLRAFIQEEHRESFVEIYEAGPEKRLVTCIEVLSPSNKRPNTTGWEIYQRKRQSLLLSDVNLVEIDLLRGGQRLPMLDPWPEAAFTLMVARANQSQLCRVWPVHLHNRLPSIPVPLAPPDADIPLDLQPMVDAIYQRSRYERSIDYTRPIAPPLSDAESAWLGARLGKQ